MIEMSALETKRNELTQLLKSYQRVMVAFSGGVDSAFLSAMASEALGDAAMAITGVSASLSASEKADAETVAAKIGIRHEWIETHEMDNPLYVANGPDRCFHCKDELYGILGALAARDADAIVIDGTNADDLGDVRPGRRAALLHNVRSPLAELGFTKDDIRGLSREMDLPTWDKPAMACLASRIPTGTSVTVEALDQVAAAEAMLRGLGMRQVRVRHHGTMARIETDEAGTRLALDPDTRADIVSRLKNLGFEKVTLDLAGYVPAGLQQPAPESV